jgi:hypothetical protein
LNIVKSRCELWIHFLFCRSLHHHHGLILMRQEINYKD